MRVAAESQLRRNETPPTTKGSTPVETASALARQTLRSEFSLIDRGQQAVWTSKLAVREAQQRQGKSSEIVLDGGELAVGYQLDACVPVTVMDPVSKKVATRYEWRPLMGRSIAFGQSGRHGDAISKIIDTLVGPSGSARRVALDSALQTNAVRHLPTGETNDVICDEIVATWDGGPMGVDCTPPDPNTRMEDDLPFGRLIDLPRRR